MIIGVIAATAAVIAAAAGVFTPASTEPALTVKESPSAIVVPPTRAPPTEASEAQQPPTDSPSPRAIPDISELDCGLLAGAKTFAGEAGNQGWAEDQDSEDVDDAFLYLNWKYVAVEFDARREVLGPGNEAAVAFEVQDSLWRFVSLADHRDLNTPFMEGPRLQ